MLDFGLRIDPLAPLCGMGVNPQSDPRFPLSKQSLTGLVAHPVTHENGVDRHVPCTRVRDRDRDRGRDRFLNPFLLPITITITITITTFAKAGVFSEQRCRGTGVRRKASVQNGRCDTGHRRE